MSEETTTQQAADPEAKPVPAEAPEVARSKFYGLITAMHERERELMRARRQLELDRETLSRRQHELADLRPGDQHFERLRVEAQVNIKHAENCVIQSEKFVADSEADVAQATQIKNAARSKLYST